jgi:prolyl oligopeptidase
MIGYPRAERGAVVDDIHGTPVPDPYRWLEDPDSAATSSWSRAQDELWHRHRAGLDGRDALRTRIAELCAPGTVTAPMWRGEHAFLLRRDPGREHPVLRRRDPGGVERDLLDPMALDPAGTTTLDHWQPDLEGRLLTVQLSRRGTEQAELTVLDAGTGARVDGPIGRCRYSPVAWLPGGTGFYYVGADPDWTTRRVYLHRIGTPGDTDPVVFGADGVPGTGYGLGISPDGRWLSVTASADGRHGLWLADLRDGDPARPVWRVVQPPDPARTVATVGRDGRLYVVTDQGCPRLRLCVGDPADPGPGSWRELVRPGPDEVLTDFAVLDGPDLLLVGRMRRGVSAVGVHEPATGRRLRDVPLPGRGTVGSLAVRPDGGPEVWFSYTDSVTPGSVYRHDTRTGETSVWSAAPGAVTVPDVRTREVHYPSADGTAVRMTVVTRGPDRAGPRPTILYGYGGFGVPLVPTYSDFTLAWVEAGGVFATAHVRGGGEEGQDWHRAGTGAGKQRAVEDLIAAAERLIADGLTGPDRLALCGESNGGLLVGAALTQRPELFAAAACSAPVLDMLRYPRSGLGASWTGEYGSPDDPAAAAWLLDYSPYHRVRAGTRYPATLFTVFDGDTRVDPLHARKMCAALQWAGTGGPVLLRREADVGHGARAAGRGVELTTDLIGFLAAHTGLAVGHAGQAVAVGGRR